MSSNKSSARVETEKNWPAICSPMAERLISDESGSPGSALVEPLQQDSPSWLPMSRSIIFAILTFGLLMIANLTAFGILGFRTLSEKMVTEKLVQGLNETRRLVHQQTIGDPEKAVLFSKQIAPRLQRLSYFKALVVLDRQGRVVHREEIRANLVKVRPSAANKLEPANALNNFAYEPRMIPVQTPVSLGDESRLAVELNEDVLEREVESLRADLNRKMMIAIAFSLALLAAGLGYVLWLYKRNMALQISARNADRMAYVGTLSSGLAHEIRNPLNSMNMNVQLIQEEMEEQGLADSEDIREMLNSTRGEIRRLEKLVSSFLAYARPTELATQPCQLNELIEETLQFLGPEIEKSGIVLKTALAPDLPKIPLDENQVKQALINVIQNGVQVLDPGKVLEITTRTAAGDKVLAVIKDHGPGISPEELKNIFKVFYSTKRGGTGLGLPTAQRIAELHRGGIKVESEVGKGAAITFIFPMERVAS